MAPLLRSRHADEQERRRRVRKQLDSEPDGERRSFGTPPGDERKLRGIPAIGRGVAGAIPGTTP